MENKKIAPTPYRTLYGLNSILKNQSINNLIKNDLNIKNQNKDNPNTNKFNYYLKNKKASNSIKNFNSISKGKKIPKIDISKLDTNNNNNILFSFPKKFFCLLFNGDKVNVGFIIFFI